MPLPARHPPFFKIFRIAGLARDRRSSVMVEAAICLPVFLILLMFIFELGYDAFIQMALEDTLQTTADQVEVGATSTATSANFISTYVCPNANGLLNCNNLYIWVENYSPSLCTDFYSATTGTPPVDSNGNVELSNYLGDDGNTGTDGNIPSSSEINCSTSGTTAFCNPWPLQQIILSAVYLAPSFLQRLLPNGSASYNGGAYHVAFDTIGFETENFGSTPTTPCPLSP